MMSQRTGAEWSAIILALSFAGAWISGQLVGHHANVWHMQEASTGLPARVCEIGVSAGLACWPPADSRWNAIKLPLPEASRESILSLRRVEIPVAFLGLGYFVFMGTWFALLGRIGTAASKWHKVPGAIAGVGLLVSVIYAGAMAFGAAPLCLWCCILHVVNMFLVVAIWRFYRGHQKSEPITTRDTSRLDKTARTPLLRREVINAVGVSLVLIAGLWFYRHDRIAVQSHIDKLLPYKTMVTRLREDPEFLLREHFAQKQFEIPLDASGSSEASERQLVVFVDYECPSCYCNSLWLTNCARGLFDNHLNVTIRHYPLSGACNPCVKIDLHPNACAAARAAEAARLVGGETAFWKMHELLFQHRKQLGGLSYENLADQIGLDRGAFLHELNSDRVPQIIQSHIALASDLGVTATPTMVLDGRRVSPLCQTPAFWKVISERHAEGMIEALTTAASTDCASLTDAGRNALPE